MMSYASATVHTPTPTPPLRPSYNPHLTLPPTMPHIICVGAVYMDTILTYRLAPRAHLH